MYLPSLPAGTILGVSLLVTFVISVAAIVQRNHVTMPLVLLNYALVIDALGIVVIGTFVWFYTLRERANFYELWKLLTREERISLQDQVRHLRLPTYPVSDLSTVQLLRLFQRHRLCRNWRQLLHKC
jgi:hypothetical protein